MTKTILLFTGLLLFYACGYQEGVVQKGEKSYIKFTGNTENVSIQIDETIRFVIKASPGSDGADNKLYQVSPGKHQLRVYREGGLVVNKVLFIDNQATAEVVVP